MVDGSIRIDTKIDQTGVNKGLADIEKSCSSFVGVASGILAGIGLFEFGKAALKSTADIELAQAKLTTLLGNADHAQSMINDIVKMADTTPYNSNDLIQAATTLKTFGVTADQIMPTLTALGNAAGGQAQNLQGVAYALGQTAAQGKMMTQDLYQFINAGVPLLDLLAKRLNKSKAEIKGMIEQGKIGYKEVNGALQEFYTGNGKYANLMAEAAKTLPGMWSTFQDSVTSFGRALVSVFEGPIKTALGVFTSMFTTLARVFNDMSAPAKNVLASFGGSVAIFVALTAAVGIATTAFSTLFTVLRSNPFMLIIGLIGTMIIKLMDLGDAAQDNMGLQPAEAERAVKTYERLIKTQDEVLKSAERAGDPKAAIAGYKRVEDALQYNIDKLKDLTPASAEWLQTVSQAAAQSKFLQTSKTLGFVTQEDVLKADELAAKFEFLYKAKRKAAAGDTGGAGGDGGSGGTAELDAEIKRRQKLWLDYVEWKVEQDNGSMEGELYRLRAKYETELATIEQGSALRKALEEKYQSEVTGIQEKWAQRHKIAAFLYGFGVTEKTAEGIESGVYSVIHATKEIGEAIADTFETIGEIFDFGGSLLTSLTDFNYSDTETALTKYITAIGDFFKNKLGALSVLFDIGAAAVEQLLAGLMSSLPAIVASIGNLMQHIADYIINNGPALISSAMTVLFAIVEALVKKAPELFRAVLVAVIAFIEDLAANASTFTGFVAAAISSIIQTFMDKLPVLVQAVVSLAVNLFDALVKNLPQILQSLIAAIPVVIQSIVAALPMIVNALAEAIPQIIIMLIDIIPDVITALVKSLPDLIVAALLYGFPLALAIRIGWALLKAVPQIVKSLGIAIARIFTETVPQLFVSIGRTFTLFFSQLDKLFFKDMSRVGGNMMKGLVEGMKKAGNIWPEIKKIFTRFVDAIKDFFGIHSPSRLFFSMGLDIIRGLINGILSLGSSLFSAGVSIVSSLVSGLLSVAGSIGSALGGALKSAAAGAVSAVSEFLNLGAQLGGAIMSGIENALSDLGPLLSGIVSSAVSGVGSVVGSATGAAGGLVKTVSTTAGHVGRTVKHAFGFASGTSSAPGGWSVVGEKGPELMNLKAGSTILSASDSIRAVMSALAPRTAGGGTAQSISISGDIAAADVVIDGATVGKIAFRYIDKQVKAAYGA